MSSQTEVIRRILRRLKNISIEEKLKILFFSRKRKRIKKLILFQDERDFALRRARDSFYSGHTSFAFQAATFLVLYLHARLVLSFKKPRNITIFGEFCRKPVFFA